MKKEEKIKYFKSCVYKYIEFFGLFDWEVHIFYQDKPQARASCYCNIPGKIASICYSEWVISKESTKKEINKVAFHEVCELFLSEISNYLEDRSLYTDEKVVNKLIHTIIRFLENKLWNNLKIK